MTDKKSKQSKNHPEQEEECIIRPEKGMPTIDTSSWPLLLKVNKFDLSFLSNDDPLFDTIDTPKLNLNLKILKPLPAYRDIYHESKRLGGGL